MHADCLIKSHPPPPPPPPPPPSPPGPKMRTRQATDEPSPSCSKQPLLVAGKFLVAGSSLPSPYLWPAPVSFTLSQPEATQPVPTCPTGNQSDDGFIKGVSFRVGVPHFFRHIGQSFFFSLFFCLSLVFFVALVCDGQDRVVSSGRVRSDQIVLELRGRQGQREIYIGGGLLKIRQTERDRTFRGSEMRTSEAIS